MTTADNETYIRPDGTTHTNTNSFQSNAGAVMLIVGFPTAVTGFILNQLGWKGIEEYNKKTDKLKVGYYPGIEGGHNITLTYKF